MANFNEALASKAARAARYYLKRQGSGASSTPRTRSQTRTKTIGKKDKAALTIKDCAKLYKITEPLLKKYVRLIKAGKPLPTGTEAHRPASLLATEDRALNKLAQIADQIGFIKGTFKVLSVRNKARSRRVVFNPGNKESMTAVNTNPGFGSLTVS